jgi:hypothetical protein
MLSDVSSDLIHVYVPVSIMRIGGKCPRVYIERRNAWDECLGYKMARGFT